MVGTTASGIDEQFEMFRCSKSLVQLVVEIRFKWIWILCAGKIGD